MRAAIFDLDGTLVDTAPDIVAALNGALSDLGYGTVGGDAGRAMIGGGARRLVELALAAQTGSEPGDGLVETALERFMVYYGEGSVARSAVYPGVREALSRFGEEGLAMGVCTNKPHAISLTVLDRLDLGGHFRAVVGGDALPEKKPAASHLLETVSRTQKDAAEVIMVGDSATDVAAARNAGVPVVVVSYGYSMLPAAELGADAVIADMRELPDVMAGLWRAA